MKSMDVDYCRAFAKRKMTINYQLPPMKSKHNIGPWFSPGSPLGKPSRLGNPEGRLGLRGLGGHSFRLKRRALMVKVR